MLALVSGHCSTSCEPTPASVPGHGGLTSWPLWGNTSRSFMLPQDVGPHDHAQDETGARPERLQQSH